MPGCGTERQLITIRAVAAIAARSNTPATTRLTTVLAWVNVAQADLDIRERQRRERIPHDNTRAPWRSGIDANKSHARARRLSLPSHKFGFENRLIRGQFVARDRGLRRNPGLDGRQVGTTMSGAFTVAEHIVIWPVVEMQAGHFAEMLAT
jgi:hypothetical protein